MPNTQLYLFQEILPSMGSLLQELERPIISNVFTVNENQVQLTLTDHYIVLSDAHHFNHPTHHCKLTFHSKFEVLYQNMTQDFFGIPYCFKLQKDGCSEQLFFCAQPNVIEMWALQLEKRVNQRGFHKLFKAKKRIGKGAFATVYLAERLRDKKMVAVKAFSKEKQFAGDKGRESLENEIEVMRRVSHRNIMRLEGVYETQNSIYVILQYLQGMQLNELIKSGVRLQAEDVKQIIQSLLNGLVHLDCCRIIHRDLKPENIMFKRDKSWEVAICDFGLATHADQEQYLFVRCGTPGFVAPEIINIRDMSTKSQPISDVFSAGVIFHYLLLGVSVFQGKKYNQILNQNRTCDFTFNKEIYSRIPPKTLDLLSKMLEKDPMKRIDASSALSHIYFSSNMDLEIPKELKINVKEYLSPKNKMTNETPTTVNGKSLGRLLLQSSHSFEQRPATFLS